MKRDDNAIIDDDVVKVGKEEEEEVKVDEALANIEGWIPKTKVGAKVKAKEISSLSEILDNGIKINESQIVDALVPGLEMELLLLGQSKGKFGGGKRRAFRQTQKKTKEGNKPKFSTVAVVGNKNGLVGVGFGKSRETVPAREKAVRQAKLNIIKIARGCGSWQCGCRKPHTLPFEVKGKCGSVLVALKPAPKGAGLVAESEIAKILKMAGVIDVWSKVRGKTKTRANLIKACFEALKKTASTHVLLSNKEKIGIVEGEHKTIEPAEVVEVKNE
jgi:small subunit ribosomal protein S5